MKMRNILFIIVAFIGAITIFSSCEKPMADIYAELDSANALKDSSYLKLSNLDSAPAAYTLVEEDYELSSNSSVAKYHNFSKYAPAKDYLPEILAQKFFSDAGFEMTVTYAYYNPFSVSDPVECTVSDAEYDELGYSYGNFSDPSDMIRYLNYKYPDAERGDAVILTYDYYENHQVSTRTGKYAFDGSDWLEGYEFSSSEYYDMDQKYPNFSVVSDAHFYIPLYLPNVFPYAKSGDVKLIVWKLYIGGGKTEYHWELYSYDGSAWSLVESVTPQSGIYKYDAANYTWIWVPPIKFIKSDKTPTREYTLTDADYELVGNGKYHNFDVRDGKPEADEQVRIDKITTILKANFNDIAFGDVFLVHYKVYTGTAEEWDITLEAVEDTGK